MPRYIARGLNEPRKRETAEFLEADVKPHPQCKPSRCSGMRIALNGAYAWLYQLLGITLGGFLSIAGGAVAQYMTQKRETTKTRNEFQRNTVVELRNALIMAMECIHEATGSADPGVRTKVILALQRVNLLQCCLDNESLRKHLADFLQNLEGFVEMTPEALRKDQLKTIYFKLSTIASELGNTLRSIR